LASSTLREASTFLLLCLVDRKKRKKGEGRKKKKKEKRMDEGATSYGHRSDRLHLLVFSFLRDGEKRKKGKKDMEGEGTRSFLSASSTVHDYYIGGRGGKR